MSCEVNEKWAADAEPLAGVTQNLCVNVAKFPDLRRVPNFQPFLSTNTYYGYMPVFPRSDDCEMDTDDTNSWTKIGLNSHCAHRQNENVGAFPGLTRKRCSREMQPHEQSAKKSRREEPVSKCEKDIERHTSEESELALEQLLKYTHGCDIYNYYSACDI
ncbi:uncharacterized protein LOC126175968 isoform X1 [Schistocerca cancellata]|uniref:uncharacterized protein LOC126175968 isoform X1 n=1 Tax=Schistocerca cancellata TaxID=274614 RepID=UPI0021187226|nr:uncharacterized protein LOC126175968 isoform X1 [Schistocerca cancellata]